MLRSPLMENYWGKNRGRSVRMRGTGRERGGGKEIWTTDKEQRGRAESKTDESADVMQKKKPENKPKKQYILLL